MTFGKFLTHLLTGAALCLTLAATAAAQNQVDLNTASSSQLQTLSGIGPSLAERILEFRSKNGPFKKIEDLMNVRGIGRKKFDSLRDKITVGTTPGANPPSEPAGQKTPPPEGSPGGEASS